MQFDATYHEHVRLTDNTEVELRLVRPDDKALLAAGLGHMSPASRYRRFFTDKTYLSPAELRYLTEVDGIDHFALGAIVVAEDGRPEGVGIARFVRNQEQPDAAEPAVAVIDAYQGRGLGRLLCRRLVAAARERGITRFTCDVLASNQPMRAILEELGHPTTIDKGSDVLTIALPLPPADGDHSAHERGPIERLLAMVAQGIVLIAQVLHLGPEPAQPPHTPGHTPSTPA